MSAILELNLKAKRTIVPPKPPEETFINKLPNKGIKLELGKKYILNNGSVTGPMKVCLNPQRFQNNLDGAILFWDIEDGKYSMFELNHPKSVNREWDETWVYEKAWKEGKPIQVKIMNGSWVGIITYHHLCGLFGTYSPSTKTFWMKKVAPYGVYNIRIGE